MTSTVPSSAMYKIPKRKGGCSSICKGCSSTVHEFGENTTIHGVSYTVSDSIHGFERFLWLLAVIFFTSLAIYWSYESYTQWQDSPVLTSIKTTGLPISNIKFPAITICSQGVIQNVIDAALTYQFVEYLSSIGINNGPSLSAQEIDKLMANYTEKLYPGATATPYSMVSVLSSDNPTETLKSKILTDPNATCISVPDTCENPWIRPSSNSTNGPLPCFANLGTAAGSALLCNENGGSKIAFTAKGGEGTDFYNLLSGGIFSNINSSEFWFSAYIDIKENKIYSTTPYAYEAFSDIPEFSLNVQPNVSALDPYTSYCVKAWKLPQYAKFGYAVVSCENTTDVLYLCFRLPQSCGSSPAPPSGARRKRQVADASLDSVFVKARQQELQQSAKRSRATYAANFRKMNLQKSYKSLFEILWYTQLPCFDVEGVTSKTFNEYSLLKQCNWKGINMPCSKLFTTFPTDRGMCCTFNMKAAEEMFKSGPYQDIIKKMQIRDKNMSLDKMAFGPEYGKFVEPNLKPEPGRSKGLTLLLDAHTDVLSGGSVVEDFDGFHAIIDSNDQYPATARKSVLIRPGHTNTVSLSASKVTASTDISSIDPSARFCLFHNEMKLEVHEKYTQANCILECAMRFAISMMNVSDPCVPWYFPINSTATSRLCDPWEAKEFKSYMSSTSDDECKHCLPDCSITLYSASVTAAPFRRCDYKNLGTSQLCNFDDNTDPPIWGQQVLKQYKKELGDTPSRISSTIKSNFRNYADSRAAGKEVFTAENEESPQYDAYKKDIALVTFFFDTTTVFEYSREVRMTTIQYISQMGGLLGLCMGFSFISFLEIFYYLTFKLFKSI